MATHPIEMIQSVDLPFHSKRTNRIRLEKRDKGALSEKGMKTINISSEAFFNQKHGLELAGDLK